MTVCDRPEMVVCSYQDVKIQLLTNTTVGLFWTQCTGPTRTWDTTDLNTVNADLIRVFSLSSVLSAFQTLLTKCQIRWGGGDALNRELANQLSNNTSL